MVAGSMLRDSVPFQHSCRQHEEKLSFEWFVGQRRVIICVTRTTDRLARRGVSCGCRLFTATLCALSRVVACTQNSIPAPAAEPQCATHEDS